MLRTCIIIIIIQVSNQTLHNVSKWPAWTRYLICYQVYKYILLLTWSPKHNVRRGHVTICYTHLVLMCYRCMFEVYYCYNYMEMCNNDSNERTS